MANTNDTYYDSSLTGAQIERVLTSVHGLVNSTNNNKILCVVDAQLAAKDISYFVENLDEEVF